MAIEEYLHNIKDINEISVAIDRWDDIFSDFDPSPIEHRTLSEDFIYELKKRHRESKSGRFIITIYAPKSLHDEATEKMVINRLKQYFHFRALQEKKQLRGVRITGFVFVACGISSLALLTILTYSKKFTDLTIELIGIVFMPLGWFGLWEGFSRIVDSSPLLRQDENLFIRLSKASYQFKHVEYKEAGIGMQE
ncbi:MAG: hypothetical protein V2A72_08680 [Candidatus Omnitrophota bacterium]